MNILRNDSGLFYWLPLILMVAEFIKRNSEMWNVYDVGDNALCHILISRLRKCCHTYMVMFLSVKNLRT